MEEAQERIIAGLKSDYPSTSKNYHVCTDTFGSIATAFPNGKFVTIMCILLFLIHCYRRNGDNFWNRIKLSTSQSDWWRLSSLRGVGPYARG